MPLNLKWMIVCDLLNLLISMSCVAYVNTNANCNNTGFAAADLYDFDDDKVVPHALTFLNCFKAMGYYALLKLIFE